MYLLQGPFIYGLHECASTGRQRAAHEDWISWPDAAGLRLIDCILSQSPLSFTVFLGASCGAMQQLKHEQQQQRDNIS